MARARLQRHSSSDLTPDEASAPLLSAETRVNDLEDQDPQAKAGKKNKMGFFDNLRGWDRSKKFRYLILLALSLSGDGW